MNHLRYSFFVCNKPLDVGFDEFTTMQVGAFYVGCVEGFLPDTIFINGDTLTVFGTHMNTECIYYIEQDNNVAIFNDLFLARPLLQALKLPVLYSQQQHEDLTFFKNVQRMKCGEQLHVQVHGKSAKLTVITFSAFLKNIDPPSGNIEECKDRFFKSLDAAVMHGLENEPDISIALSGGVDSGSIASLVRSHRSRLTTYTVSTDWGDEYIAAKETADFLGIPLELVHITKEEIIREIPNVIRYFHFTSPESIEIALVAHCLYKKLYEADAKKRTFFTGYGSDLLNAGVYSHFNNYEELHADCMKRVIATQLSNEFSNLSALNHGVKVFHPFWETNVISAALQVPAKFKVIKGQDKFYFREMMSGKLPDNTVWRKKLGAHHGTGLSQHLQNVLGDGSPTGYQHAIKKLHEEIFCYGNYDYHAKQAGHAAQLVAQPG